MPMDEATHHTTNQGPVQGQVSVNYGTVNIQMNTGPGTTTPTPSIRIWNIPYRRNPFFTGREDVLELLHERLGATRTATLTQSQAISGLGGIGKTQIVIEYAYRHRQEYTAVLWVNAATRDTITASFLEIATLLALPEQQEGDLNQVVMIVKRWFVEHEHWLLIFDNADDLQLAEDFLPPSDNGALLLTTRHQAPGTLAIGIDIAPMEQDEGMLLLLRRAKQLPQDASLDQASPEQRALAKTIVEEMGGLPLAIDQAAAFIEETRCSLEHYHNIYQRRRMERLQERGNDPYKHHPIATTWSLNFEQIEQSDSIATDLLHMLAFLAPDAIPEDLLFEGASELGPHLRKIATDEQLLDTSIRTLSRFSLVKRNAEQGSFSIHRLVQDVLRTRMTKKMQRVWAERTVRAVSEAFPNHIDFPTWSRCERYLPHALACARLIKDYTFAFSEAASLLHKISVYLHDKALFSQAEPLYQDALRIYQKALGPEHPSTATTMDALASLYQAQGRYEQAEPLYQDALRIYQKALGPEHPSTAATMHALASLYQAQGRYEQAEPLYQDALRISKKAEGPEHPSTATTMHALASLYQAQGRYEQAEPLYQDSLAVFEKVLGTNHPTTKIARGNYEIFLARTKRRKKSS